MLVRTQCVRENTWKLKESLTPLGKNWLFYSLHKNIHLKWFYICLIHHWLLSYHGSKKSPKLILKFHSQSITTCISKYTCESQPVIGSLMFWKSPNQWQTHSIKHTSKADINPFYFCNQHKMHFCIQYLTCF